MWVVWAVECVCGGGGEIVGQCMLRYVCVCVCVCACVCVCVCVCEVSVIAVALAPFGRRPF